MHPDLQGIRTLGYPVGSINHQLHAIAACSIHSRQQIVINIRRESRIVGHYAHHDGQLVHLDAVNQRVGIHRQGVRIINQIVQLVYLKSVVHSMNGIETESVYGGVRTIHGRLIVCIQTGTYRYRHQQKAYNQ